MWNRLCGGWSAFASRLEAFIAATVYALTASYGPVVGDPVGRDMFLRDDDDLVAVVPVIVVVLSFIFGCILKTSHVMRLFFKLIQ